MSLLYRQHGEWNVSLANCPAKYKGIYCPQELERTTIKALFTVASPCLIYLALRSFGMRSRSRIRHATAPQPSIRRRNRPGLRLRLIQSEGKSFSTAHSQFANQRVYHDCLISQLTNDRFIDRFASEKLQLCCLCTNQ